LMIIHSLDSMDVDHCPYAVFLFLLEEKISHG
jgi:hypothetical protein